MARPRKEGLEYFPLDVTAGVNDEIELLEAAYGLEGFAIYIKLLQAIYKSGYFMKWSEKEQLLFSKRVNVTKNRVNEVITSCLEWGLFDKAIYDKYEVLTSHGIQQRFLFALGRRTFVEMCEEYLLLSEKDISDAKTTVNVTKTQVNVTETVKNAAESAQRKEKNSKEKVKEKESKENSLPFLDLFEKRFGLLNTNQLTPEVAEALNYYKSLQIEDALVEKAIDFALAKGKKNISYVCGILRNWVCALDIRTAQQLEEHTKKPAVSSKVEKFNSMYTHDWDLDELERLEEEHLAKELRGKVEKNTS